MELYWGFCESCEKPSKTKGGWSLPFGTKNFKILNKNAEPRGLATTKVQTPSFARPSDAWPSGVAISTINAADLVPRSTTVRQARSARCDLSQQTLFREFQKASVVDDALATFDATHEVSERGIVDFESVTQNISRSGIECFIVDKSLSASFDCGAQVRCFRAHGCATSSFLWKIEGQGSVLCSLHKPARFIFR